MFALLNGSALRFLELPCRDKPALLQLRHSPRRASPRSASLKGGIREAEEMNGVEGEVSEDARFDATRAQVDPAIAEPRDGRQCDVGHAAGEMRGAKEDRGRRQRQPLPAREALPG